MKSELEFARFWFRLLAVVFFGTAVVVPSASAQANAQTQAASSTQAQPACTPPAASGDQTKTAAAESGVSKAENSISSIGSIFGKKKPSPTADKVANVAGGCDPTVNNALAAAQTIATAPAGSTISSMLSSASGSLSSACNQAIASNAGAASAVSKASNATSAASNLSSAAGAKNDPQKASQTANAAVNCNPAALVSATPSGAAAAPAPAALASSPAPASSQIQNPIQAAKDAMNKAKQQPQQQGQAAPQQKPGQQQKPAAGAPPNAAGPFTPPPNVKIEQTVVGPAIQTYAYAVSPHGTHVATNTHDGSRQVIIYDGVEGPKFDQIYQEGSNASVPVVFSPDGNRYAYCGQIGDQWVVVVDGKILVQSSDSINGAIGETSCELGFTSNSKHLYFTTFVSVKGSNTPAQRFVFDGKAGPPGVSGPVAFSPDGEHFAYTWVDPLNQTGNGTFVVDGKPTNDLQNSPQWTADGAHLYTKRAFSSKTPGGNGTAMDILRDGKPIMRVENALLYIPPVGDMMVAVVQKTTVPQSSFLVIGGKQVPGSENTGQASGITDVVFSPDGKHYSALYHTLNGQQFAFSDGKKGLNYPRLNGISNAGIGQHTMAFTADSSKLVYIGFNAADNGQFLVINGQESQELFALNDTVFSPVGDRVATDGQGLVTLDGKILNLANVNPRAATVSQMTFSPDGSHLAFRLQGGGTIAVYLDGVAAGNAPANAEVGSLVFSPDRQHFGYFCRPANAANPNDEGLCLDGKFIPFPPGIFQYSNLTFSPDSKHLFWRGQLPPYGYRIFVDGNPAFDGQLNQGSSLYPKESWQMGADGSLTVLTTDATSSKRVNISVTQ
jgi:hypothetical protein